ncbi:MAG: pirin-like C-terminal cupin domain-containing protein [Gammaproteobacteria bacterium]
MYWDCRLDQSARLAVPPDVPELAIYVVSGEAEIDSEPLTAGSMAILSTGVTAEVVARRDSRLMVLGGAAVGPREIWWNFVAPDSSRIEQAKLDWVDGRFGSIEGDDEFIPLPD